MKPEHRIKELEQRKREIINFTNELDEKLRINQVNLIEHKVLMNEQYPGKNKEELMNEIHQEIRGLKDHAGKHRKAKTQISIAGTILIILAVISLFSNYTLETPTGSVIGIKQITQTIDYNKVFGHYTETQLNINDITSLKISGELQGTRATIKLRINNTDYLVADIVNEQQDNLITGLVIAEQQQRYVLSTDKASYAIGETVYIIIEPNTENKSLYINYKNETHKLEGDTYTAQQPGEHQVIALIVLPDDILRLETSFTVINETINTTTNESTNQTVNETINQTNIYKFTELCTDTCNILETSNPILIVELEENSTLTITEIIVTQNKENQAPEQTKTIPDIIFNTKQTATLDLNEYFTDPDQDTLYYDINEIPEINTEINQELLTITSNNPGTYTAYIYATDGDKLTTSNTFQIIITETNETINITETDISEYSAELNITPIINQTINETVNETIILVTNITPTEIIDPCKHPNPNKRPPECIEGKEEEYFKDKSLYLMNLDRALVARITAFGNLVIKGRLIENSTANPGPRDFRISYFISYGEQEVTTAWIETSTGDLHLRGRVYEEQFQLLPSARDTFMIQNIKGTNLGYFERETGNLYLRGNLIQERPELDIRG